MAATATPSSVNGIRAAVTLAVALAAAALVVAVVRWSFGRLMEQPDFLVAGAALQETVFTLLLSGTLLAVAALGLWLGKAPLALIGPQPAAMLGIGSALGLGGLGLSTALAALALTLGHRAGSSSLAVWLGGSLVIMFQASVEEVYFRGWLQPVLARSWGDAAGIAVTAAAFAALHLLGGERSLVTLLNLMLGGVLFGLLAQRSGGIVLPAAAHFAWNWAEAIGLGLTPNPGVGSFGAIVDLDLIGSANWGGSAEGLNASLAMTFVLAALLLPAAAWRWPGHRLAAAPA
jgi:membrane protease YdiL (CAAX protease family)